MKTELKKEKLLKEISETEKLLNKELMISAQHRKQDIVQGYQKHINKLYAMMAQLKYRNTKPVYLIETILNNGLKTFTFRFNLEAKEGDVIKNDGANSPDSVVYKVLSPNYPFDALEF